MVKINLKEGKELMYTDYSKFYDLIYSFKDYKKESQILIEYIKKYKKSKGNNLLELGCGSGKHLFYLKDKYNCLGTDINKGILNEAKINVQNVKFKQVDMVDFNLNAKFDIIVSLFSAIGYVKTKSNLKKTIKNISNHLKIGGVVIIEPWFPKPEYISGKPLIHIYEDEKIKVCRMCVSKVKGNISVLDFHFMVAEENKEIFEFRDIHELGLFDKENYFKYFQEEGIDIKFIEKGLIGRGLFIGIKK